MKIKMGLITNNSFSIDNTIKKVYNKNMENLSREEVILNLIKERGEVTLPLLMDTLYVSESTVRRELKRLEEKGLIIRSYGKAVLKNTVADINIDFFLREGAQIKSKVALAKDAVNNNVSNGSVIFLDASSTAMQTVRFLSKFKDVIVITSGIKTLFLLNETNLKYYSTGGQGLKRSLSLVGQCAIDTINTFNADVCFISCHGLSDDGFATDTSIMENELRQAIMKRSKKKVLLIDSTKIGINCWHNLCHISDFDEVYCDKPLPKEVLKDVKNFYLIDNAHV
ncbi:MAG: DeoR/GlpR transcriptional regulator [Clostridia bacterium]|nr:DeoR/GlpR transcriptional regulator [Clostridia bacterium]